MWPTRVRDPGVLYLIWQALPLILAQPRQQSPRVLLQGRFGGADNAQRGLSTLPLLFTWPSSSVYVTFIGESINATLSALPPTITSTSYCLFVFCVDQREAGVRSTAPDGLSINWTATSLGPGQHNLTITKISEASYGEVSLEFLSVAPDGMFLTPSPPPALLSGRRIMFIGDSYTVGYANTGGTTRCRMTACNPVTQSCGPELDSQNAALSWGPLTAANFSADYQVLAWSGAGLVTYAHSEELVGQHPELPFSVAQSIYPTAIDLFKRQIAADNTSAVSNYSSWIPQVVVLAGGTNDFPGLQPTPFEEWSSEVISFIDIINTKYNNPYIIILAFSPQILEQGVLPHDKAANYVQYMTRLFNQTQQEHRSNVYFLQLNAATMPFDDWCASHPSIAADANIAAQLSSFIDTRLSQWTKSSYPLSAAS